MILSVREEVTLPLGLLALYGLGSVADSLALTATTIWLNKDLHMRQETQTLFYAAMFVPYSLKPSYGLVSELVQSRRLVYVLAIVAEALLYAVCGLLVHSIPVAFTVVIARETCAACAEMMLSAVLADTVTQSSISPENAQAQAGGARWLGTITGYLIQLWLYSCDDEYGSVRPRHVIASTALVLLPTAILGSFALPVTRTLSSFIATEERNNCDLYQSSRTSLGCVLIIVQALCVWITLKHLVSPSYRDLWRAILWLVVSLLILVMAFCIWKCVCDAKRCSSLNQTLLTTAGKGIVTTKRITQRLLGNAIIPAILVFALNAAPTAGVQISNLEYYLFFQVKPCYLPYLELIMAASALAGCTLYAQFGQYIARRKSLLFILFSAAAAAPLAFWPLAKAKPIGTSQRFCLLQICIGRFGYDALVRAFNSFISEFALTAQTAITLRTALALSGHTANAATYGALLALVDSGASISGWMAAPLVARANIGYDNYSRLPWLLRLCALMQFLAIIPLFALATPSSPINSQQHNDKLLSVAFISSNDCHEEDSDDLSSILHPAGSYRIINTDNSVENILDPARNTATPNFASSFASDTRQQCTEGTDENS